MCSIFGFNWEDKNLTQRMLSILQHRGPDGKGYITDKQMTIGSNRLRIIDISKKADPPLSNEQGDLHLVFNGEIYNFKKLKAYLQRKGHEFKTETDSEVVLHLYEEEGKNCLNKLNGMFAFCIYDSAKKEFFLARDPIGIKPLYYYFKKSKFLFASEIKALLEYKGLDKSLDYSSIKDYMSFRYVPGKGTFFENIKKLLPGQYMIFSNNKLNKAKKLNKINKLKIEYYWNERIGPSDSTDKIKPNTKKYFQSMEKSVQEELISDVPLGVYLSGGIDSSTITGLMSQNYKNSPKNRKIKTFGISMSEDNDEEKSARSVSEYYGTKHYQCFLDQSSLKNLNKIIWHQDDLVADPIILANYELSLLAKKHVKVVLCGEGADELLCGYSHYRNILLSRLLKKAPEQMHQTAGNLIHAIPKEVLNKMFNYPEKLGDEGRKRVVEIIRTLNNKKENYTNQTSIFTPKEAGNILRNDMDMNQSKSKNKNKSKNQKEFNQELNLYFGNKKTEFIYDVMNYEFKNWLPNYILNKLDKLTMCSSIEGRVPFLNKYSLAASMNLPLKERINLNMNKVILRKSMKTLLPEKIIKRKKHPFYFSHNSPLGKELAGLSKNILLDNTTRKRKLYNQREMAKLLDKKTNEFLTNKKIFSMLGLEIWFRTFVDRDDIRKPFKI